jgi:hypothetical protein
MVHLESLQSRCHLVPLGPESMIEKAKNSSIIRVFEPASLKNGAWAKLKAEDLKRTKLKRRP